MQHVDLVKGTIFVRQRGGIPVLQRDPAAQANPSIDLPAGGYVLFGQVDARNRTSKSLSGETAGASKSATDVENLVICRNAQFLQEACRSDPSAYMKFVCGAKLFEGDAARRFAEFCNAIPDCIQQGAMGVVSGYRARVGHGAFSLGGVRTKVVFANEHRNTFRSRILISLRGQRTGTPRFSARVVQGRVEVALAATKWRVGASGTFHRACLLCCCRLLALRSLSRRRVSKRKAARQGDGRRVQITIE